MADGGGGTVGGTEPKTVKLPEQASEMPRNGSGARSADEIKR